MWESAYLRISSPSLFRPQISIASVSILCHYYMAIRLSYYNDWSYSHGFFRQPTCRSFLLRGRRILSSMPRMSNDGICGDNDDLHETHRNSAPLWETMSQHRFQSMDAAYCLQAAIMSFEFPFLHRGGSTALDCCCQPAYAVHQCTGLQKQCALFFASFGPSTHSFDKIL